jgi:hypothetical protein
MLDATTKAKNKLSTFKMPSRVHKVFDEFYQSTMSISHTPSPEKSRPNLLESASRPTLLGKALISDYKKDPFKEVAGTHKLLE